MQDGVLGRAEVAVPRADRDRFIDLIRVLAMVVVVILRWTAQPALEGLKPASRWLVVQERRCNDSVKRPPASAR